MYLNPTMISMLSLILLVVWRTSINNNDNRQMQWDLTVFYPNVFEVHINMQ